jgi:hypothetical protein
MNNNRKVYILSILLFVIVASIFTVATTESFDNINMLGYNITNATYLSSAYFQCSGQGVICLFPDNDANTGIMFDGPDTMSIHTGGSQAVLVNSQQQVGLLMTPNQRLTVNGSGNFTGLLYAFELASALNWTNLQNYPTSCPAGTYVTSNGDTNTCTAAVRTTGENVSGDYNFSGFTNFHNTSMNSICIGCNNTKDNDIRLKISSVSNSSTISLVEPYSGLVIESNSGVGGSDILQRYSSQDSNYPAHYFAKSRGSLDVPLNISSSATYGMLGFYAYQSNSWNNGANIYVINEGTINTGDTTDLPSAIYFDLASDNSATPLTALKLNSTRTISSYIVVAPEFYGYLNFSWLNNTPSYVRNYTQDIINTNNTANTANNTANILNSTKAQIGSVNCTAGNVLFNVTSNTSGLFGGCVASSSGGNPFNQSLNTSDNPTFNNLTLTGSVDMLRNNTLYIDQALNINSTKNITVINITSAGAYAGIEIQSQNDGSGNKGGLLRFYSTGFGSTGLAFGTNTIAPESQYWKFKDGSTLGFLIETSSTGRDRFLVNGTDLVSYQNTTIDAYSLNLTQTKVVYGGINLTGNFNGTDGTLGGSGICTGTNGRCSASLPTSGSMIEFNVTSKLLVNGTTRNFTAGINGINITDSKYGSKPVVSMDNGFIVYKNYTKTTYRTVNATLYNTTLTDLNITLPNATNYSVFCMLHQSSAVATTGIQLMMNISGSAQARNITYSSFSGATAMESFVANGVIAGYTFADAGSAGTNIPSPAWINGEIETYASSTTISYGIKTEVSASEARIHSGSWCEYSVIS